MVNEWNVVTDCDTESGEHTCWSLEINHELYGKYVWITLEANNEYSIEVIPSNENKVLTTCKSLASAKRWVTKNLL